MPQSDVRSTFWFLVPVCKNQVMRVFGSHHWIHRASTAVVGTLVLFATGCSGSADPYAGLTEAELVYVIPESGQWAVGDPCAEADCSGPIDSGQLSDTSWIVVDAVNVIEGEAGEERTIRISMDIERVLRGDADEASLGGRAWGQDVGWVIEALAAGHEVWAATECPGLVAGYVCHFVAIDTQGRFAGIGYGKGLMFTIPLAREAAGLGATTGRQFLEGHL